MEMFPGGFKIHPESQRILENIGILSPHSNNEFKTNNSRSGKSVSASAIRNPPGSHQPLASTFGNSTSNVGGDTCGVHALLGSDESNCLEVLDIPSGKSYALSLSNDLL
jgi:hypothetical protein